MELQLDGGATTITDNGVLVAAAEDAATGLPARWVACLIVEGMRTTDRRAIALNALTWRDLPLPLAAQFENEGGHYGSVPVGTIETITREGNRLMGTGTFDLGSEQGREAARLCNEQVMRFVSADLEVLAGAFVETEDGDYYEEVLAGRVGMATMVMFPAFPQACIVPEGMALPEPEPYGDQPRPMLVAAAFEAPEVDLAAPPAEWFDNPQLDSLTHFTVTEQGRVFGHLAGWGIAHRGIQGRSVYAPRSNSDYAHFATGRRQTAEGEWVRTGPITMGVGHAPGNLKLAPAAAHYDDTNFGVADVAIGEDEHGIWMAGALRPGVTVEQFVVLNASDVSGDWRPAGAGLELVAALVVNVAGFLIPNSLVASACYASVERAQFAHHVVGGDESALIAAGLVHRVDPVKALERRMATMEAAVAPLMALAVTELDRRMEGGN